MDGDPTKFQVVAEDFIINGKKMGSVDEDDKPKNSEEE